MCIDLCHSRLILFIKISIKITQLQQKVPIMTQNLITFRWVLVKFHQMTLKSVANVIAHNIFEGIYQNFDLFLAKHSNF